MKRMIAAFLLTGTLTGPAQAQQLLAWPMEAAHSLRAFLPGRPLPAPTPPPQRPLPLPGPAPRPAPGAVLPPEAAPISLSGYRVEGQVTDQAAELTHRISFHNPTDRRLEGVLMVPIPADAVLSGFSMSMGGKDVKGELLDAAQAASVYQAIVSRAVDPGLLELVGERMFRARVFPIESRGEIVATLKLTQALPKSGGLVSLRVPLASARFLQAERGKASARIALKTTRPLRTVFSPVPGAEIARQGERAAVLTYEEGGAGLQDLALLYSLREDPLAAGLLAFREPGEDGSFMLTLSPPPAEAGAPPSPKDVVFVLDRSGSMQEAGKMEQARQALRYCVSRLRPGDRFGIVDFATDWSALHESLLPATDANKARALRYVDRLEAAGGTNIGAGLEEGLRLLSASRGRVPMMFFLTDGLPTVGQTDIPELLRRAARANAATRARIFSFGIGADVNTLLLDKLAEGGRGARDYVAPGEDIELKVGALYQKVDKPALTDVRLEWRGLDVADVLPRPVPDLFSGGELTLYGRYRTPGSGTLVVTGRAGGRPARFEFPVELPARDARHAFVPRLWATQKIARELDAIRLSERPADPETVASIVRLAKKHGIVTPYTSFLVTEEGTDLAAMTRQAGRRIQEMADGARWSGSGAARVRGAAAQADSMLFARMGAAPLAASPASASGADKRAALADMERAARAEAKARGADVVDTRSLGGKTFYRRGAAWVDGEAEGVSGRPETRVKARSAGYFALLSARPGLARFLSLGDELTVLWEGTLYWIEP